MPSFIDLSGRIFGRLTVLRRGPDHTQPSGKRIITWDCRCACGSGVNTHGQSLRAGVVVSCGCYNREVHSTHGGTRGGRSKTYRAWCGAKERCHSPTTKNFRHYGGRGIQMCERWRNDYSAFLADMGECPPGYSIERKDYNGNYEPSNCIWIPLGDQAKNRRTLVLLEYSGETLTLADFARRLELPYPTVRQWYRYDCLSVEEIVARANR